MNLYLEWQGESDSKNTGARSEEESSNYAKEILRRKELDRRQRQRGTLDQKTDHL